MKPLQWITTNWLWLICLILFSPVWIIFFIIKVSWNIAEQFSWEV